MVGAAVKTTLGGRRWTKPILGQAGSGRGRKPTADLDDKGGDTCGRRSTVRENAVGPSV